MVNNANDLRRAAGIFTPASFRRVCDASENQELILNLSRFKRTSRLLKVGTVLENLYKLLETNYRTEYIYKNVLLKQELLTHHCLRETTMLDEFRIGGSIADFVLLNGEIRVYEIKSDLDNFEKLQKQLDDYRRFASRCFLVVSGRHADRAIKEFRKSAVGILVYDQGCLVTAKEGNIDNEHLSHDALFRVLRKSEYLELIRDSFGYIPSFPNTQIFRECLTLANRIPVLELQGSVREILKRRRLHCPEELLSNKTPQSLKQICFSLNLKQTEYRRLYRLLDATL